MSIYSQVNHWDIDDDFRLKTVRNLKPNVVVDLGCGNGRMTFPIRDFTKTVIGIDPDLSAIKEAKQVDINSSITWIHAASEKLHEIEEEIDVITMLTNVSQEITDKSEWLQTLQDCYDALDENGKLIFDGRNFYEQGFLNWTKENTIQNITLENGEPAKHWHQLYDTQDELIRFNTTIESDSKKIVHDSTIIFRTKKETIHDLKSVGFKNIEVFGDWKNEVGNDEHNEFLFVATK